MKKITTLFLALTCLSTSLYSKEYTNSEALDAVKQIRKEIAEDEIAQADEASTSVKADKKYKQIVREPLDQRVFRTEGTFDNKFEASEKALEIGYERMFEIRESENSIKETEKYLGVKPDPNRKFLSDEFDRVQKQLLTKKEKIQKLQNENVKLQEYLTRLDEMEQKITSTTLK